MDILYFAFYNDPQQPLEELQREDREINQLLEPLSKGRFEVRRSSFASLEEVIEKLTLYKDDLTLFHFGGHAGQEQILLEGGEAKARGLAELLGQCPKLQGVVLNGCATAGQVDLLQEQGAPFVIASYRPVQDHKARVFATQFYRALSYQQPVGEAFSAAIGAVHAIDQSLDIPRAAGRITSLASKEPMWGMFELPGREDALSWRLPLGAGQTIPPSYQPNALLIDALQEALAPYVPAIDRMRQEEQSGEYEYTYLKKRAPILAALPHPVSEQLSWLFSAQRVGETGVFYDKPNANRLRQLVRVFDIVVELMAFMMLAQLWDALFEKEGIELPEESRRNIRAFLHAPPEERRQQDLFALIRSVRQAFDEHDIPYFVEELQELHPEFQEGRPFYEAARFLEAHRDSWKTTDAQTAAGLAVVAEEKLATVLSYLGFMARYTFTSVRNIDLLKHRHEKNPRYKHTLIKLVLETGVSAPGEEKRSMQAYFDSASVLVVKDWEGKKPAFLNLTPFVLDENAFDKKAPIAKLHFLQRYIPERDAYAYRHIYMPDEKPLVVAEQPIFRMVKAQFDAFARLLFHCQTMRDAV
ncbi:MAG: CHAT domain-containing protein [Phaeodactylibacter sp.]|nr:CHAT domain-containing protein [Phaeodactylibacter sp.]